MGVRIPKKLWLLGLFLLPMTAFLLAFPSGPPPFSTAGFQDGSCVACHNDHGLDEGRRQGGILQIEGIPRVYQPGQSYPIRVLVGQPGQSRWGFQVSARFQGSGQQAGQLLTADAHSQVAEASGVQFVGHSEAGTRPGVVDGPVEFQLTWTAPETASGGVLFNAAGNAANGDGRPSGDYIYTAGGYSAAPGGGVQTAPTGSGSQRALEVSRGSRDSGVVLHLPKPLDRQAGQVDIIIQHRFLDSLDSGPGEAFGIDAGANINLGINYAPTERLNLGLARARFEKLVTLSGSLEIQTDPASFWNLNLVGGVEGQSNFKRQYSPFLQLATGFDLQRVQVYAVPTVVFNSRDDGLPPAFLPFAINPENDWTFSLGMGADLAINNRFSLVGEYTPRLAGFGGFITPGLKDYPTVAGGVKIRTWGHVFTLMASTSRDFTPATYGVNATRKDLFFGFNIFRKIR